MPRLTPRQIAEATQRVRAFNRTPPPGVRQEPVEYARRSSGVGGAFGSITPGRLDIPQSNRLGPIWGSPSRLGVFGRQSSRFSTKPGVSGSRNVGRTIQQIAAAIPSGSSKPTVGSIPITYTNIPSVPTLSGNQSAKLNKLLGYLSGQLTFGGGAFTAGTHLYDNPALYAGYEAAKGAAGGPQYAPGVDTALQTLLSGGGAQYAPGVQDTLSRLMSGQSAYTASPQEDIRMFQESFVPGARQAFEDVVGSVLQSRGRNLFGSGTERILGRAGQDFSNAIASQLSGIFQAGRERELQGALAGQQTALGALGQGVAMGGQSLQGLLGGLGIGAQMGQAGGQQALNAAQILSSLGLGQAGLGQSGLATLISGLTGAIEIPTSRPGDVAPANYPYVIPGQQNVGQVISGLLPALTSLFR